jgi:hypothetical protein
VGTPNGVVVAGIDAVEPVQTRLPHNINFTLDESNPTFLASRLSWLPQLRSKKNPKQQHDWWSDRPRALQQAVVFL